MENRRFYSGQIEGMVSRILPSLRHKFSFFPSRSLRPKPQEARITPTGTHHLLRSDWSAA